MKRGFVIQNLKGGYFLTKHGGEWSEDLQDAWVFPTWQQAERLAIKNGVTSYVPDGCGDGAMFEVRLQKKKWEIISNPMSIRNPLDDPMESLKEWLRNLPKKQKKRLFKKITGQEQYLIVAELLDALTD